VRCRDGRLEGARRQVLERALQLALESAADLIYGSVRRKLLVLAGPCHPKPVSCASPPGPSLKLPLGTRFVCARKGLAGKPSASGVVKIAN